MNLARKEHDTQAVHSQNPAVLADIYHEHVNLAVWQAQPACAIRDYAQSLCQGTRPLNLKIVGTTQEISQHLATSLPADQGRALLLDHLGQCCAMFSELFEAEALGLRLETLEHAMCPRFHVDNLPVRLITTLHGVATQWLPAHAVERRWLGRAGAGQADETSGLIRDGRAIQQLETGDVALMKGEGWEGNHGRGLVHRSPEPAPGDRRLVLTLDWIA